MNEKMTGGPESSCSYAKFFAGFIAGVAISFMISFFTIVSISTDGGALWQKKNGTDIAKKEGSQDSKPSPEEADGKPPVPSAPPVDFSALNALSENDWVLGDRNAPITIVEYTDTECPFCKQIHATLQDIVKKYEGKVNWVYRHHPVEGLHAKAKNESLALECAGEQGGNSTFWKYTDLLYETTPTNDGLDPAELPKMATKLGLNLVKFQSCMKEEKYMDKVEAQIKEIEDAGIQYTPFSLIIAGDKRIPIEGAMPQKSIEALIDPLL